MTATCKKKNKRKQSKVFVSSSSRYLGILPSCLRITVTTSLGSSHGGLKAYLLSPLFNSVHHSLLQPDSLTSSYLLLYFSTILASCFSVPFLLNLTSFQPFLVQSLCFVPSFPPFLLFLFLGPRPSFYHCGRQELQHCRGGFP